MLFIVVVKCIQRRNPQTSIRILFVFVLVCVCVLVLFVYVCFVFVFLCLFMCLCCVDQFVCVFMFVLCLFPGFCLCACFGEITTEKTSTNLSVYFDSFLFSYCLLWYVLFLLLCSSCWSCDWFVLMCCHVFVVCCAIFLFCLMFVYGLLCCFGF